MLKYEMIPDYHLFRIRALRDVGQVKKGADGGLIEKEGNLSQEGDSWIHWGSRVSGNAWVKDNAVVYGGAPMITGWATGDARVSREPICISGLRWDVTISDNHIAIFDVIRTKQEWIECNEEMRDSIRYDIVEFWDKYRDRILNLAGLVA